MVRRLLTLGLVLSVFISLSINIHGQIFKPNNRRLFVIKTEKFDIIFPEKSRRSAEALSLIVDNLYRKHSALLKSEVNGRIPITLTPDVTYFNAFAVPIPYPAIVLYDTPLDNEWTTFENNLESVFLHELIHVLSLSSANAGWGMKVFGSWANPALISTQAFMVEGVTVSHESITGFGRANDPLVKQRLRQDIRDGNFKTPIQASATWDKYPYGAIVYEYGGLFSKYIQDRFGMEKYADFWKNLQTRYHFSFVYYNTGTYKAFKNVYGLNFIDVWNDFQSYMTLKDIPANEKGRVTPKDTIIEDLASFGSLVYYIDRVEGKLKVHDTTIALDKKNIRTVLDIDTSTSSINISKDGRFILLSSVRLNAGFGQNIVREFDINKKRYTGRRWMFVNSADFFRGGIIGIVSDLHNGMLVYHDENGNVETLLPPSEILSYSSPTVIDDNRIALIVTERGIKSVRIYNYSTKSLAMVRSTLANDANIWKYVRTLKNSAGRLMFTYNDNDRFYKLGVIDTLTTEALFFTNEYSGAISKPVIASNINGNYVYYVGHFSEYSALMKYTNSISQLNPIRTTYSTQTMLDTRAMVDASRFTSSKEASRYNGAEYFKPWAFWVPLPLINDSYSYFFNGVSIFTMIANPFQDVNASVLLGFDIPSLFLQSDIKISTTATVFPLQFQVISKVIYNSAVENSNYWIVSPSLNMTFYTDVGSDKNMFYFTPYASAVIFSDYGTNNKSAFTWGYKDWALNVGANLTFDRIKSTMKPLQRDHFQITLSPAYSIKHQVFQVDGLLRLQSRYMPIRFEAFGAWTTESMLDATGNSRYFGSRIAASHKEFVDLVSDNNKFANWIAGGSIELLGAANAQFNISHMYFNNFFASVGYNALYYANDYMHSLSIKLGTKAQINILGMFLSSALSAEPFARVALILPRNQTELQSFDFSKNLNLSFGLSMSW